MRARLYHDSPNERKWPGILRILRRPRTPPRESGSRLRVRTFERRAEAVRAPLTRRVVGDTQRFMSARKKNPRAVALGRLGGQVKSARKTAAARENVRQRWRNAEKQ